MPESSKVYFATSNVHKFQEASIALREFGMRVLRLPSKGTEVQSDDVSEIARLAAASAFKAYHRPLIVEDTRLSISALGGFPGAYGSYVYRTIGLNGVLRLMNSAKNRAAEFVSAVAYCDGTDQPTVFVGSLKGEIARVSRGVEGFGFDPIFIPEGRKETLAELPIAAKCRISHRSAALREFASWATTRASG